MNYTIKALDGSTVQINSEEAHRIASVIERECLYEDADAYLEDYRPQSEFGFTDEDRSIIIEAMVEAFNEYDENEFDRNSTWNNAMWDGLEALKDNLRDRSEKELQARFGDNWKEELEEFLDTF